MDSGTGDQRAKVLFLVFLVVLTFLVVVPNEWPGWRRDRWMESWSILATFEIYLEVYHAINGRFPAKLEDLFDGYLYDPSRHDPRESREGEPPLFLNLPLGEGVTLIVDRGENERIDTYTDGLLALHIDQIMELWEEKDLEKKERMFGDDKLTWIGPLENRDELLDNPPNDRVPFYANPHDGVAVVIFSGKNGHHDTDTDSFCSLSLEEIDALYRLGFGSDWTTKEKVFGDDLVQWVFVPWDLMSDLPRSATGETVTP